MDSVDEHTALLRIKLHNRVLEVRRLLSDLQIMNEELSSIRAHNEGSEPPPLAHQDLFRRYTAQRIERCIINDEFELGIPLLQAEELETQIAAAEDKLHIIHGALFLIESEREIRALQVAAR
ncbi:MAG: hypothetical protein Q9174_003907, partial [Haloplaca sp. 1 TL-2023]